MKYFNILIMVFVVFVGCKQGAKSLKPQPEPLTAVNVEVFGAQIGDKDASNHKIMFEEYQKMQLLDTLSTKFSAIVKEVCKSKGCWMKLQLGQDNEVMVKFKDYGFFMPKDIEGREVVVNGLAFVEEMSVEEQRHFAEDGGKTKEEIAQIIQPKKTYSFVADGVLLK
ncbi:DUF4920 domain-containing protein [Arenibacter certesii]|uniref:DUF4920 domain-containing protein n=1 Tax=Arenibacter certesii TaxID=228955 RepID=A0A918ITF4_9FLAO|nr:DUF4920 domain-containing protein [Arenibacter certesii]GGW27234.1 hypothetical protein GCM10007383_10730 [Arenibacter certesii]